MVAEIQISQCVWQENIGGDAIRRCTYDQLDFVKSTISMKHITKFDRQKQILNCFNGELVNPLSVTQHFEPRDQEMGFPDFDRLRV